MSRRVSVGGLLFVAGLLTLAGASPLAAQETEAELQRAIDSLAVLVDEAAEEAEAARTAREEAARRRAAAERAIDTLRVSGMTIVAPLEDAAEARELFQAAWSQRFRGYGSPTFAQRVFTYQRTGYTLDDLPVVGDVQRVAVPAWYSDARAEARVGNAIAQVLTGDLEGTPLDAWLQGSPFTRRDPAGVYREMVLARSGAVERCLAADVAACTSALGLGPDGRAVDVWYTPAERRVRALEKAGFDEVSGSSPMDDLFGPALARCAEGTAPDACDALLDLDPESFIPLSPNVRATLAARALERGGDGAWARLVDDPSMTPEEALAHAADLPLDELVSDWRAWIVRSRPEAQAGLGAQGALALLWILFFAALATRSTRWRFA